MSLYGERFVPTDTTSTFYKEHLQRYRSCKAFVRGKRVLDLGCGTGYGSAELLKLGAREVIGIDIDPQAMDFARTHYINKKISFLVSDATSLPFPNNSFDVVVSFEVIEHIKNYKKYINEMFRVLKKEGYVIFSTPNKNQYRAGTSPYHFKEFAASELKTLFKPFGTITLFGQFFTNPDFVEQEKAYFTHYNVATGGSRIIKKALHLIPSSLKSWVYKQATGNGASLTTRVVIKKTNLDNAVTLIGVCRKR